MTAPLSCSIISDIHALHESNSWITKEFAKMIQQHSGNLSESLDSFACPFLQMALLVIISMNEDFYRLSLSPLLA